MLKLRAGKNTFFKPRYYVYNTQYKIKTFYASEHILFAGFFSFTYTSLSVKIYFIYYFMFKFKFVEKSVFQNSIKRIHSCKKTKGNPI